jgi:hypothetical protein
MRESMIGKTKAWQYEAIGSSEGGAEGCDDVRMKASEDKIEVEGGVGN